MSDLLEEELRQPSPESAALMAEALAEIKTQLARLDDLVQDYLSLVRVAADPADPRDLGRLVRSGRRNGTALAAPTASPSSWRRWTTSAWSRVHANTLRRALLNLVQNAMEAMPQGGTLTLRGRRRRATVQLDVGDTGIGIPPEQRTQIFEPLYTTKPGGTGLGLYIVQEVVAAHGGQVAVQSTVGHGTTFTITLPLAGT